MRYKIFILLLVAGVLLASVSAQAATTTVNIQNNAFTPRDATIKAGDTVTWTNQDSAKHDVDFGTFKSPLLGKGETYSHAFDKPGTYDYSCDVHPSMKGRVMVQ